MSADLRARIAEALTAWSCTVAGVPDTSKLMPQHREAVEQNSAARADAVMAVVQPELDAQDTEIAEQTLLAINAENARAYQQTRAEQAEAELEQWRACFGETALKDARKVLTERDRLRAAVERVRTLHHPTPDGYCRVCSQSSEKPQPVGWWVPSPCPTLTALDQAPAAEQDGGA